MTFAQYAAMQAAPIAKKPAEKPAYEFVGVSDDGLACYED